MQKQLLILVFGALALNGCDKIARKTAPSSPAPNNEEQSLKAGEKVTKNFDLDIDATQTLQAEIKSKFAANATTPEVETALKAMSYECRIDPTHPQERGCDKMETKDTCIVMSVIKTLPFVPDGAQVIKVCDVAP